MKLFSSLDSDAEAFLDNADSYVEGRDYAENQMIVSFKQRGASCIVI